MESKKGLKFFVLGCFLFGSLLFFGSAKKSYALPRVDNYSFTLRMTNNGLNWLNTQVYSILTAPTTTTMIQDLITKAFTDPTTGQPKALVDTCLSIPLVGMTCLAVYMQDWDGSGYVFTYTVGPTILAANPTNWLNAPNGTLKIGIALNNIKLDVHLYTGTAYTTTTGASITDYVLAHGYATVPSLSLSADLTVVGGNLQTYWPTSTTVPNPQPGTQIGLRLISADIGVGFHFSLTPDPVCPVPLVNDGSQTYKSCLISSLIPYIDAQFNAHAEDNFNSALEYYFGPTMLLDAGKFLTTFTFDHPLVAGGKISMDAGFFWDFKADGNGVEFYPGGLGLALKYNLPSCVTIPSGAGPIVMNPISPDELGGTTPTLGTYMFGVAVHENVLSELLYNVYTDGILCLDINKNTPTIGSTIGGFLTTTVFGFLMPVLQQAYPDKPMQISLRPTLLSPETGTYNKPTDTPYIKTGAAQTFTSPADWGSLQVNIPHFILDFYVDTTGTGIYQRVFGLDLSLTAGFGISVWTDPTLPATARVIRVLLEDQPGIQAYLPYAEALPITVTGAAHVLSQILPTLLTTAIKGRLDVAINLAPLLGITFDVPYIGPIGPPDPITGNPSFYGVFASLVGNLDPALVFNLINSMGLLGSLPAAYQPSPMQLGLAYPRVNINVGNISSNDIVLNAKQTKEAGFNAYTSVIDLSSYEENGQNPGINYTYSLDKGPWRPFINANQIVLHDLLEGGHILQVQAVDSNMMMSPSSATLKFDIDSIPPTLSVAGPQGSVNGSIAKFVVGASDYQTPADEIKVSYNLDNKGWTIPATNKNITLTGLTSGNHAVNIRAYDLAGNTSEVSANFTVINGAKADSFGCSTADTGNAGIPAMLIIIFAPLAFVFVLKKVKKTVNR